MDSLLRVFLPIYLTLYVLVAFVWRSYVVWKRTGVNPYVLTKTDDAHGFIGLLFRLSLMAAGVVVLVYVVFPGIYPYLTPIALLQTPLLTVIGIAILVVSLIWIAVAQAQMGDSWRIGVDQQRETELVNTGLFSRSRNPIFLGMRLTLIGLFLVLPNAITLTILVVGDVLMQIQVRLEEEHLLRLHGTQYESYRRTTPRWL